MGKDVEKSNNILIKCRKLLVVEYLVCKTNVTILTIWNVCVCVYLCVERVGNVFTDRVNIKAIQLIIKRVVHITPLLLFNS